VLVDGADAAHAGEAARSRLRRRIGFSFPGGPMIPGLPLWENVTYGLVPAGASVAARRDAAAELLCRVGLAAKLKALPEELSTGERNRAAIARALAGKPEALLVDEPLANLDADAARHVADALATAHRGGATLVVASHAADAFPSATSVLRMESGRVTHAG
jgi:putative ABC transport system ATP-binding protein